MKLILRKSECLRADKTRLVKSPKEAIRKTLSNYLIKDGLIIKVYIPSYVSSEEAVLRDEEYKNNMTIRLRNNNSFINIAN